MKDHKRFVIYLFLILFGAAVLFIWGRQKSNRSKTLILKIPWIVNNSFCEVINNDSKLLYVFPWNFCLITSEGFLGAIKDRLTFLNNKGEEVWVKNLNIHHDLFYDRNLRKFTIPVNEFVAYKNSRLKIDKIVQLDLNGNIIFDWNASAHLKDLEESFGANFSVYFVKSKNFYETTYINGAAAIPNSPLAIKNDAFRAGNILVSLNKVGLFILNPYSSKIVWTFKYAHLGAGQIHAARFQENGTILFFLNKSNRSGYSQIIQIRPDTGKVVWTYNAENPMEFYSEICGSIHSTDSGSILVTHISNGGRAFELNQDGKVVWHWTNHTANGSVEPLPIYRLERFNSELLERMPFVEHFRTTVK
jgi:outer membrane protein assembly factor BamB